jgi:RimJ/RimL family protein N-acetyltransferase
MTGGVLRPLVQQDADDLHVLFTEPGVRRFLFDDRVLTRLETQRRVAAACRDGSWTIRRDGAVVGFASLRPAGGDRELLIAVSESCWGRGIAFEAAQAVLRHGFDGLGLPRIVASVDLPNQRSHRLMERLGLVACGESAGPRHRLRHYEALRRSGT